MKFDGVVLYVSADANDDSIFIGGGGIFHPLHYPVPQFAGELIVKINPQTEVLHKGTAVDRADLPKILRPYYERPRSVQGRSPEELIVQMMTPPYVEGLWIRVWGTINIRSHTDGDAMVDTRQLAKRKGDMDIPIQGYMPWDFWVEATKIDLEVQPELVKTSFEQLSQEEPGSG